MKLSLAESIDLLDVEKLYKSVIGTPYCVWNEEYPTIFEIEEDYKSNCLYVLKEDTKVIGAVSVNHLDEMSELNNWTKTLKHCEIARVVINKDYQNKHIGYLMIKQLLSILKEVGYLSVRLAVEINHLPAIKLYEKCGFNKVGNHYMYGHDYYLYEYLM